MACELRKHLVEKYGGFADRRHKNVEKDFPISMDDFDSNSDILDYVTFINLNVIDNNNLRISFSNNLDDNFPYTDRMESFLESYKGQSRNSIISIEFDATDFKLLNFLISEFQHYYSDSPNYAWIGPRIVKSLNNLLAFLQEFNN